jgi:O-acetyl-ADP-ribose deacetylase (regulator of RNase III)
VYSKSEDRSDLLRSCYRESLAVAEDLGAETVAFPLISAGVFGWPKEDAIRQALDVLLGAAAEATDAAPSSVREVTLVLFDSATFELARRLRG